MAVRGRFRVRGQDRVEVVDDDNNNSYSMTKAEYDKLSCSPEWKDLEEVDPVGGPPQPQRSLRRPSN